MKTGLACASLATILSICAGCGSTPANKKIAFQIVPNAPRDPAAQPLNVQNGATTTPPGNVVSLPTQPEPPEVLASKAQAYAKSMEAALAKRNVAKAGASPEAVPGWTNPNDFRIGGGGVVETKPLVPPVLAPPAAVTDPTEQANASNAVEPPKVIDASNRPIAIASEPVASKASAVIAPSSTDLLDARVTKRVKDYPRDVSANLDYQIMLFLHDQPVPDLSAITGLPTEDRELISALMDGLSNFRSTIRSDNNMLLSRKIRPLTDLADRLRTQAELSIPTVVLCTKVDGFGRYDPIEPPRFAAQKENQAIVYCELENFASQLNTAKQYQTDVIQETVLYSDDGMQVWQDKTQQIQDLSRNRRHDFFLCKVVKFPASLTVGRYMLKVTITDRQANRVAESSLPIQITSQSAAANEP